MFGAVGVSNEQLALGLRVMFQEVKKDTKLQSFGLAQFRGLVTRAKKVDRKLIMAEQIIQ